MIRQTRRVMYRVYWTLQKIIAPGLRYSQYEYREVLDNYIQRSCRWLDLGCGHELFGTWMLEQESELVNRCLRVVGADLDFMQMKAHRTIRDRVAADAHRLPFIDRYFDIVTANMVVEHLTKPLDVLGEIRRVLHPSGLLILHTPNRVAPLIRLARHVPHAVNRTIAHILENRPAEDVYPTYYRLNEVASVQQMALASGFDVLDLRQISSSAVTAALGPLAIPELLYLRVISSERFCHLRTNIIAVLRKPGASQVENRSEVQEGLAQPGAPR